MIFENDFDYVIPFGFNCNSAYACKIAGVRKEKLPFDWMRHHGLPENLKFLAYHKMVQDMYDNSLKFNIIKHKINEFSIVNYKSWIPHESGDCDCSQISEKYEKYFSRLKSILESNSKILIVMSELDIRPYNNSIVPVHFKFLKSLYPNNEYYFLTININSQYINTNRHLNVIINERAGFVGDVYVDNLLTRTVEICKNIKVSDKQNNKIEEIEEIE